MCLQLLFNGATLTAVGLVGVVVGVLAVGCGSGSGGWVGEVAAAGGEVVEDGFSVGVLHGVDYTPVGILDRVAT
mgnify:CR=1 FL=1